MGIPDFLRAVRAKIGQDLLVLPSVSGLVRDGEGRVLLIRHSLDDAWVLPGGIVEPDEFPAQRLVEEMREETGLVVLPKALVGVYGGPGCRITYPNGDQVSYVVALFECEVIGGNAQPDGLESLEVRYFSQRELDSLDLSVIGRTLLDASANSFQFPS